MDKGRRVMHEVNSLSLFVGTGRCNADCSHCAGKIHRKFAPEKDGVIDEQLIYNTLRECYQNGARYLSISSSGEPTLSPLSVTRSLELIALCRDEGMEYSPINLYSNGIRIGNEKDFCDEYLPKWKNDGLRSVYVTVHDIDEKKNAEIYGIKKYPNLQVILGRIHGAELKMRANLVLSQKTIDTFEKFIITTDYLLKIGIDSIAAWPLRDMQDRPDSGSSPIIEELTKMENYVIGKPNIRILTEKSRAVYHTGKKVTLFPNGQLSNTWCN